jgi:AcrR family transcriptional regulator
LHYRSVALPIGLVNDASMSATGEVSLPVSARDRLINAADRLFYQRGLHVGINDIVAAAGVAKTSLYLHFASKDDLVATYLASRTAHYLAQWRSELVASEGLEPHARLDVIFDDLRIFVESDGYRGCPYVNAAVELPDTSHPAYAAIIEYRRYVRDELFAVIVREAGVNDVAEVCAQLQVIYDGSLASAVADGSAAPIDRARAIAHTIVRAAERPPVATDLAG